MTRRPWVTAFMDQLGQIEFLVEGQLVRTSMWNVCPEKA
jgi:hypothetical protein